MEVKIEVTKRRGRRRKQLLDDPLEQREKAVIWKRKQ